MHNMERILTEIEGERSTSLDRFVTTKKGWSNGNFERASVILEAIKSAISTDKDSSTRKTFTIVRKGAGIPWAYRTEEALERLIVLANKDTGTSIRNQVNLKGKKESVDLAVFAGQSISEIIELKPWGSGNNPIYAAIESIKNYFLGKNSKFSQKVALTILAPDEYYDKYSAGKGKTRFFDFTREVKDLEGISITAKSIALNQKDFNKVIERIAAGKSEMEWKSNTKTKKYSHCIPKVEPRLSDIQDIAAALRYENWNTWK